MTTNYKSRGFRLPRILSKPRTPLGSSFVKQLPVFAVFKFQVNSAFHIKLDIEKAAFGFIIERGMKIPPYNLEFPFETLAGSVAKINSV